MYSWELEHFINNREWYIGGDDLEFVIDTKEHPQIDHIKYDGNFYYVWTTDNYYFKIKPMPIEEAKEKGLVKSLVKKTS